MSIGIATNYLVSIAQESALAERRRDAWKQHAGAAKATFQEAINTINMLTAQRAQTQLGLVIVNVTSRWDGLPAFGISLTTESPHLNETRRDGDSVDIASLNVTEPTLALAPTFDGKIRAIARMSTLSIREEVLSPAPAPHTLAEFDPKDLTDPERVEGLLSLFLSQVAQNHWTKRR
jgi:hypothetical protein